MVGCSIIHEHKDVDVRMNIEEVVHVRCIFCGCSGLFSTPFTAFVCYVIWHNHRIYSCPFSEYALIQVLCSYCRLLGDCVTIYWLASCGHGTTASHSLLHLPWTHSCGTILSQNDILCQLTSLELLSSHLSQRGWHVGTMAMVQWLNLL